MTDPLMRQRAEAKWQTLSTQAAPRALTPEASLAMLHELQVHQIELEMQNEELRQAQAALEISRASYMDLYDLAPVGYCTVSDGGTVVRGNLTLASMLGVARGAWAGHVLSRWIAPQDQDAYYQLRKRLRETGNPQSCELRMLGAKGTPFWAQLDAADAGYGSLAMRLSITNIQTRKEAEQAVRQHQTFVQVIADTVPGMLGYWTADLKCGFANHAYRSWFGRSAQEMDGIALQALLGDALFRQNESFARAALAGHAQSFERTLTRADGTVRHTWAQYMPHRVNGCVVGFLAVVTDITPLKQVEQDLMAALHEKNALLKEVHHRVKNNLQVINSLLRLETRRAAEPQVAVVLQAMQGRIYAMAQLHDTLCRAGTFASVDLGAYLGQIATQAFQAQTLAGAGVRLQLNMGSLTANLDQAMPCGLLVNELVSNCLKHGFPQGRTGVVCITLQPADPASAATDAVWRLQVHDTGVGLPADMENRRVGALGLQLAGDLSQQMGGTLDIQSQPGGGAAFSVKFTAQPLAPLVMP